MRSPRPHASFAVAAAVASLALACAAGSASAARNQFRDPYLGGRVAFTSPDRTTGCVARLTRARAVTCDSRPVPGDPRPPYARPGTPPAPSGCLLGWGVRYMLPARGRPFGVCASTWIGTGHRPLRRGRRLAMGDGIVCRARARDVRCVNRGGHGILLSPRRVRLF